MATLRTLFTPGLVSNKGFFRAKQSLWLAIAVSTVKVPLARRFKGEKVELDDSVIELRMLTQPIFRYAAPKKDVIDGVIFAFAEATIPTIFLFVEAYQPEQGDARFRWAACEQHFIDLTLYLDDKKVWSRPRDIVLQLSSENQRPHSLDPYFTFFAKDIIPKPEELNAVDEK